MTTVFFAPNPIGIAEVLHGPAGPVTRDMVIRAERVKREAIRIAPRRTGNLAAHIVKRVVNTAEGVQILVGVENVPYAIWVHEGAQPHTITARRVPNLVFFWEAQGRLFVGRSVNHPGNRPNRFLVRALQAAN